MNNFLSKIKMALDKYVSPVFIMLVFLSLLMWYLTKLSYTYQSQVPVSINIEGNKFKIECLAEGTGYKLFSYKVFKQTVINLNLRDIQTTTSAINPGNLIIDPYSLQNAISIRTNDLRILSVGDIPEIKISYPD